MELLQNKDLKSFDEIDELKRIFYGFFDKEENLRDSISKQNQIINKNLS